MLRNRIYTALSLAGLTVATIFLLPFGSSRSFLLLQQGLACMSGRLLLV